MTSLADFETHPPAYPLDRDAFKRALKTGHGRALVHARDFGLADFRDEVLDAAMDCKVYDEQIDGQREWWLARLCESGSRDKDGHNSRLALRSEG
ncbi:MAG: hypothetical protein EOP83_21930 [Verrucomicrobiaceae bacterium]|nr:MAG: hypothetical protein EOP83_21930 [Verrucomicrobiaceae bacterium]